jgi:hypothetical protein
MGARQSNRIALENTRPVRAAAALRRRLIMQRRPIPPHDTALEEEKGSIIYLSRCFYLRSTVKFW